MARSEIYVSCDVEADGPIPGQNSLLAYGAVAITAEGEEVGEFGENLEQLPGARSDPETMEFWGRHPEAWACIRSDLRDPAGSMARFVGWIESLPGSPVFVGYPVAYDFLFIYWYLRRFGLRSPFSHSALDIKTLAMVALGTGYRASTKRNMPRRWFRGAPPHDHTPVADARGQAILFARILGELRLRDSTDGQILKE